MATNGRTDICGFEFHNQLVPYSVRTSGKCKLSNVEWVANPDAAFVASVVAEAEHAQVQHRRVLASRLICRRLEQLAWSLARCYITERSLLEEIGPNMIDRSIGKEHTDDHGDSTETNVRMEEVGPKTINERSLLEELGQTLSIDRPGGSTRTTRRRY